MNHPTRLSLDYLDYHFYKDWSPWATNTNNILKSVVQVMVALPSEEMLWIDWAFLMPAELLWLAAAFATGLISLRESMMGVRFFWIKRWPVVLSEPWDSCCLLGLLFSMRGRTSEIRGRTTPLVVLLSLHLFKGNKNAVLQKKIKMEDQCHVFPLKCHWE